MIDETIESDLKVIWIMYILFCLRLGEAAWQNGDGARGKIYAMAAAAFPVPYLFPHPTSLRNGQLDCLEAGPNLNNPVLFPFLLSHIFYCPFRDIAVRYKTGWINKLVFGKYPFKTFLNAVDTMVMVHSVIWFWATGTKHFLI